VIIYNVNITHTSATTADLVRRTHLVDTLFVLFNDTDSTVQVTQFGTKNRTTTMQYLFGEVWHIWNAFSPCFRNTLQGHFKGRSECKLVRRFSMNCRQKRRSRCCVLQLT